MFGFNKQARRKCRTCKTIWFVDWKVRDITIPRQPGSFSRAFTPRYKLDDINNKTQFAVQLCSCPNCGSTNFSQKQA